MKLSLSTYLKAFATVTIIGPWAMFVMSGVLFGGFVPMMGLGHPMVLVGLAWVYCSAMVLWRPSSNRLYRLGTFAGLLLLSWMIYQKGSQLTFRAEPTTSNELLLLRDVLGHYVVLGAWLLSVILLLPVKHSKPANS
jgi:hypothetical protein